MTAIDQVFEITVIVKTKGSIKSDCIYLTIHVHQGSIYSPTFTVKAKL